MRGMTGVNCQLPAAPQFTCFHYVQGCLPFIWAITRVCSNTIEIVIICCNRKLLLLKSVVLLYAAAIYSVNIWRRDLCLGTFKGAWCLLTTNGLRFWFFSIYQKILVLECQKYRKILKICICRFQGLIYRKLKIIFYIQFHFILEGYLPFQMCPSTRLCLILTEKKPTEVSLQFSRFLLITRFLWVK